VPVMGIIVIIGVALVLAAGTFVLERMLPASRREMHNDVVGFIYAVVGVAYAVLLGLVVIAAWNGLDEAKANTYTETDALIQLDWYGHSLPQPQHGEIESLLKQYATVVINVEWPELARQQSSPRAWAIYTQLRGLVQEQRPATSAATIRYQQALEASAELGNARRERVDEAGDGIPVLLWGALILGAAITVGFSLFFGMKSTLAHATLVFCVTLLLGSLLLVVFELNYPFGGLVRVGPEAFTLALQRLQVLS
jgi:ABC-type cobalt transport system substrate-binding protein